MSHEHCLDCASTLIGDFCRVCGPLPDETFEGTKTWRLPTCTIEARPGCPVGVSAVGVMEPDAAEYMAEILRAAARYARSV